MTLQLAQPAGIIMAFGWHGGYLGSGFRANKSDIGSEARAWSYCTAHEPRVVVRVVHNLDTGMVMPSDDAKLEL